MSVKINSSLPNDRGDWLIVSSEIKPPRVLTCSTCKSKRLALIASQSFRDYMDEKEVNLPENFTDNPNNYTICYDCYGDRFGLTELQKIVGSFKESDKGWRKLTEDDLEKLRMEIDLATSNKTLGSFNGKDALKDIEVHGLMKSSCGYCNKIFLMLFHHDKVGTDIDVCLNCLEKKLSKKKFEVINKEIEIKDRRFLAIPSDKIEDVHADWIGTGKGKDLKLLRSWHEEAKHETVNGFCSICHAKFMVTAEFDAVQVDEEYDSRTITELVIASLKDEDGDNFFIDFMERIQLDLKEGKAMNELRLFANLIIKNLKSKNDPEKIRYLIQEEVKKIISNQPNIARKIKYYSNFTDSGLFQGDEIQEYKDCPNCKGNQDMIVEGNSLEEVKKNTGDHIVKFHPKLKKIMEEAGQDIFNLDINFQPPSPDLDEFYNLVGEKLPEEEVEDYKKYLNKVHYMKISNDEKKVMVGNYGMKILHKFDKHEIDSFDYCAKCNCLYINGEPRKPSIPIQARKDMSDCQTCIGMFTSIPSSEVNVHTTLESPVLRTWIQHLNDDHQEIFAYIQKHGWVLNFKTSDGKSVQLKMSPPKKPIQVWRNYYQAVSFLKKFNITSKAEYKIFCKSDDCPDDIPQNPDRVYPEFKDWATYLSARIYDYRSDTKAFTPERLEEFRQEFVANWKYYSIWTDGMITDTLRSLGLFNHKDPKVRELATSFMDMWHDPATKQTLYEHLSKTRFNMQEGHFTVLPVITNATTNTKYLKRGYTKTIKQKKYGLMYEEVAKSVQETIESCRGVKLLIPDSRYIKLIVDFTVKMIWKRIFDPRNTGELDVIQSEQLNGNLVHDKVLTTFQDEYDQVVGLKIGNDYDFHHKPNLMQLYTAYKLKKLNALFNMSRTGTGKTNSAIIASRATYSKFTMIFSPLSIVDQWEDSIKACYKEQSITKGVKIFDDFWSSSRFNYHIMNYDKLSHSKSSKEVIKQIKNLVEKGRKYNRKIHFIIIDEAQNVKIRNREISTRRQNLDIILKELRKLNPKLKVLALSATPVINNVREGKSLLEMITGENYKFLKTIMNVDSATALHTEFQPFTIRYIEQYDIEKLEHYHEVISTIPLEYSEQAIRKFHWRDHEDIMIEAKIPKMLEVIKNTEGKVIVYTDFVEGITDKIADALTKEHISFGFFTGQDKDGMQMKVERGGKKEIINKFVDGDIKVLVASMPVAEGVDRLQYACNNIIFVGLPWTYARLEQIVGRLVRTGQTKRDVHVHIIKAIYNGFDYDQRMKLDRLNIKKALGNCVVDGTIPNFSDIELKDRERKHFYDSIIKNQEKRLKKEFVK